MAGAGAIRAGAAYVEITANSAKLNTELNAAKSRLAGFGASINQLGKKFSGGLSSSISQISNTIIGIGAFEGLRGLAGGAFNLDAYKALDEQLKAIQSVANPTAEGMKAIGDSINKISVSTGQGPAEVARVFTELQKAGLSTEAVIGGAAKAVVQFAKIGGIATSDAAITMADALNVFKSEGLSATDVVNTLASAADESSTSIKQISESFAQSSAVFKAGNQTMLDIAAAVGILGNEGIKGSDAGTSLKTFMVSLLAPTDKAKEVIAELGINIRDTAGQMLPIRDIIQEVSDKTRGLSGAARDNALRDLFGTDALRASIILLQGGAQGFDNFKARMGASLSVSEKFKIVMSSFGNQLEAMYASIQRVGVAIGEALAGPLGGVIKDITKFSTGLAIILNRNPDLVVTLAKVGAGITAAAIAAGAAVVAFKILFAGIGIGLSVVSGVISVAGGITAAIGAIASFGKTLLTVFFNGGIYAAGLASKIAAIALAPVGVTAAILAIGAAIATAAGYVFVESGGIAKSLSYISTGFDNLKKSGVTVFNGIVDAIKSGDLKLAGDVAMAGLNLAFQTGILTLKELWSGLGLWFTETWHGTWEGIVTITNEAYDAMKRGSVSFFDDLGDRFDSFETKMKRVAANTGTNIKAYVARDVLANPKLANEIREGGAKTAKEITDNRQNRMAAYGNREQSAGDEGRAVLAGLAEVFDKRQKDAKITANQDLSGARKAVEDAKNALNKLADAAKVAKEKMNEVSDAAGRGAGVLGGGGKKRDLNKFISRHDAMIRQMLTDIGIDDQNSRKPVFKSKVTTQGFFNTSALYGQQVGSSATTMEEVKKHVKKTAENTGRTADKLDNLTFDEGG